MRFSHIVWDWNGTILNDAEACALALSRMLEKRNMGSLSLDVYREKIAFPAINMYYESGFDLEKESYQSVSDEYISNYLEYFNILEIHKDAATILEKFQKDGLKQYIVSASGINILQDQIEKYGLRKYFTYILGQENNQAESKVHLARRLTELTGFNPAEVLFIGDTVHDYEVAAEAGFSCALVSNGHCSKARLEATGAPVYSNLTDLYNSLAR